MSRLADKIFVAASAIAALGVAALGYDPYPNAGNGGAAQRGTPAPAFIADAFSSASHAVSEWESPFHGAPRQKPLNLPSPDFLRLIKFYLKLRPR